jgi:hypothetical protein
MYVTVYTLRVIRTNIYLTEVEQAGLDAKAEAAGSTRSDIVRSIVDRDLNLADDADLDTLLWELAPELAGLAREIASGEPELRID